MKLFNEKLVKNKLVFKNPQARWASAVLPVKKPVDKKANAIADWFTTFGCVNA
jgi:hypothetical protein